jgi:hypothetical protein
MTSTTDLIVQAPPIEDLSGELALVASNAAQMQEAQQQLVGWFAAKIKTLEADRTELELEVDIAMRNGWRTSMLNRQLNLVAKRILFYDKCRRAAEAGYCLVPNITEKTGTPQERTVPIFRSIGFEEIDFPISICKPRVMQATAQAMAMKVFDEIAVVDDHGA